MNSRRLGAVLMAVGGLMVLTAAILAIGGPSNRSPSASAQASPSTSQPAERLTTEATTSESTTTAPTTTSLPATTSTAVLVETVEEFVGLLATALANGDSSFVQSRLHPRLVERLGSDVCQAWVETEIMGLSEYEMTGDPSGPVDREFSVGGGPLDIEDVYTVPVRFSFGGQTFDSAADFAMLDGLVYWLGVCE